MELSVLRAERDSERRDKERLMSEMEKMIRDTERREGEVRQKVCLLINAKKAKIAELKARVLDLEQGLPKQIEIPI